MRFNASTTLQKKTQNGGSLHILVLVKKERHFWTYWEFWRWKHKKKQRKYAVSRMYLKNYDISCLINSLAKSNSLFWYYIKQTMNVFIRAMVRIFSFGERWNVLFNSAIASLNRTFHLSPHENILTKIFGERWNVLFNSAIASLNRTFHLSPHENILTIALKNIHYLYITEWFSVQDSVIHACGILGEFRKA